MKKIIVVPDSYKGTMSSLEICDTIRSAINSIDSAIYTVTIPVSDGGEGMVDCFLAAMGGKRVDVIVKNPLNEEINSFYALLDDENTAVIEMAAASGLPLIEDRKNPLLANTYGTGQLILHAVEKGCKKIIIGIGGSATNDGGIGMAAALGVKFLDETGKPISLDHAGLEKLFNIDASGIDSRVLSTEITVACDVSNPLCGENGATYIYGQQKGATQDLLPYLDKNLERLATVVHQDIGCDVSSIPGAGAAGGLGAGLIAFTGATLKPGADIVLDMVGFEKILNGADMVITGEGQIDGQSMQGKLPVSVAMRAKRRNIPVIAIVGAIAENIDDLSEYGISAVFSINRMPVDFSVAKGRTKENLFRTVQNIIRFTDVLSNIN